MNFCNLAYAIMAYALGNLILIPVNAIFMGDFWEPQTALGFVISAAAITALYDVIRMINEFQLTPGEV